MGARRGGRDQGRAQADELVGLDDDRVASAALLSPPGASWRRQPEDLTANHVNRALRGQAPPSARERLASRLDPPRQQPVGRPLRRWKIAIGVLLRPPGAPCEQPPSRCSPRPARLSGRQPSCHPGERGGIGSQGQCSTHCATNIGAPGFEPGTSPTRTVRATRLRHAPKAAIISEQPLGGRSPRFRRRRECRRSSSCQCCRHDRTGSSRSGERRAGSPAGGPVRRASFAGRQPLRSGPARGPRCGRRPIAQANGLADRRGTRRRRLNCMRPRPHRTIAAGAARTRRRPFDRLRR